MNVICKLCGKTLGKDYVTLVGSSPEYVFQACWECAGPGGSSNLDGAAYHPSYHDDGPPPMVEG